MKMALKFIAVLLVIAGCGSGRSHQIDVSDIAAEINRYGREFMVDGITFHAEFRPDTSGKDYLWGRLCTSTSLKNMENLSIGYFHIEKYIREYALEHGITANSGYFSERPYPTESGLYEIAIPFGIRKYNKK